MSRSVRKFIGFALMIAALGGFGAVTSCNIIGGSSGGTGNLKLLVTDGPTDDWTEVTVHFLSASLHRQGSDTWESFWTANTADPASGKVNLVDLSGVTEILQAGTIKAGSYDRLKLIMNTSTGPESMNLVADDGTVIKPEDITVADPSGVGEIKIDLSEDLVVETDKNNILSIDFDLAHPLSIVNLDGKVVISLKVRTKRLPRDLGSIQFVRTLGDIAEATANADGTAMFTIKTVQGALVEFTGNGNTAYTDLAAGTPASGNFEGLKALAGSGAALVASNMNSDGSLYARRVWYAGDIASLPRFTPEGLVRRVGENWFSIQRKRTEALATGGHHLCDWNAETVFVDAATVWNFQGVDMGLTGTAGLRHLARGFRVEVTYVSEDASPKVAQLVNIQFAHAEGLVVEPTLDAFKLGWMWRFKTMIYSEVGGHEFGWWFYGTDSTRSTDRQALIDSVAAARTARLWVFAGAGLTWDAPGARWVVEDLVLAPMKLHDVTKITTGYSAAAGTMDVSTFNCWDWTTPEAMTIKLDHAATGAIQTVVGSFIWKSDTNIVTFTLPVLPSEWQALLTSAVDKVKIWVHPVKEDGGTLRWHAYSVIAYQFIR